MNNFTTNLILDLNCNKDTPTINSAQFDKGRIFSVAIKADGEPFTVTGCEATLKCVHSDRSCTSIDCTDGIDGSTVIITLREDTLPVRGITAAKLVFTDGTRIYSTQIFLIDVDSCLDGNIAATEAYSILNKLIEQIHTLSEQGLIIVDNELKSDSSNPVENRVIKAVIDYIISNKEDSANKVSRITQDDLNSTSKFASITAMVHYLLVNYYSKTDIDDSTYTKTETDEKITLAVNGLAGEIAEKTNLFVLDSQTLDGITVKNLGEGVFLFSGSNSTTTLFPPFILPAGTYIAKIETLSGTANAQFAIKYGAGSGTTWPNTGSSNPEAITFTTKTIAFFRLNYGTFNDLKLRISITEVDSITAVDSVARATSAAMQEQLSAIGTCFAAQSGPFYPLAEPDDFTWENSPLHGKILTDFRDNYYVDFDVVACRNPIGKAFYVAPHGSDSNDGTPGAPFASISKAYTEGADTIFVYPGIYNRSTSLFGTEINRDLNVIGLGDGAILCTRITNIPNVSPYVTQHSTGVWRCYPNSKIAYISNVVDIAHKTDGHYTKYTQLATISEVRATPGSWALINESVLVNINNTTTTASGTAAYIHTLDGSNPLAGNEVLLLNSPNPAFIFHVTDETAQTGEDVLTTYPLIKVTGGKVYFENLICLEGSAPLSVEKQSGGSNIEIYAKNCKFFYSRSALATKHDNHGNTKYDGEGNIVTELIENDVCMLYGTTLSIFQDCEASFGLKDGFGYHMGRNSLTPPKAIEINCIGVGNGNIEDGNDQGSTIHDGGSIIRVRDICTQNYGANYADAHSGTESWNIGCTGFESLCDYSNIRISDAQNSNFLASDGAKVFCEGCVGFGSLYNVCATSAGTIYLRNSRFEGTLTKNGMTPIYY